MDEKKVVRQFDFMASKNNLRAFFTDDEKGIVTVADSFGSANSAEEGFSRDKIKQDVIILSLDNTSGGYFPNQKGVVAVSTQADNFFQDIGNVILVREIKPKKPSITSTEVAQIPFNSNEGEHLLEAFRIPNRNSAITFSHTPVRTNTTLKSKVTVQRRNLETGNAEWASPILLETEGTYYPGSADTFGDIVFSPDGKKFATLTSDVASDSVDALNNSSTSDPLKTLRMWETETGKASPNFNPLVSNIRAVSFDETGSHLVAIKRGGFQSFEYWEKQLIDVSTGQALPDNPPVKFNTGDVGSFYAMTPNGNFAFFIPPENQHNFDEFAVASLDGSVKRLLEFADSPTAVLALNLLQKALAISFNVNQGVRAEFNKNFAVEIDKFGNIDLVSKNGSKTRIFAPFFSATFDKAQISSDGKSILKFDRSKINLFESKTKQPIVENLNSGVYVELLLDDKSILTIDSDGKIRLWKLDMAADQTPSWIADMGEALSGMEIQNDISTKPLTQKDYLIAREKYLRNLKVAGKTDAEAQTILNNWKP